MSSSVAKIDRQPFFLPSVQGKLFSVYYPSAMPSQHALLIVPPFAEELNRSRRMFSLLAQSLATIGVSALIVDLYGTGDSEGEFADACWEGWHQDLICGYEWLLNRGVVSIDLLALRSGALLADQLSADVLSGLNKVCLWQPQTQGARLMRELLRQKASAEMLSEQGASGLNTRSLEEQLKQSLSLDIGGYLLSPSLYKSAIASKLTQNSFTSTTSLAWFDVSNNPQSGMARGSQLLFEAWKARDGSEVGYQKIEGEPFWQLYECADNHALVQQTVDYLLS